MNEQRNKYYELVCIIVFASCYFTHLFKKKTDQYLNAKPLIPAQLLIYNFFLRKGLAAMVYSDSLDVETMVASIER